MENKSQYHRVKYHISGYIIKMNTEVPPINRQELKNSKLS